MPEELKIPVSLRAAVAEAVHESVCEVNGGDGYGRCVDYAVAGALVLNLLSGRRYSPQVGGVDIMSRPPDEYFYICGEDNGFARGEYHAWVACAAGPAPGMPGMSVASEWIDFSSRHYRRMAETMLEVESIIHQGDGVVICTPSRGPKRPWTAPEPPPYLWHEGAGPPPGALFYVDEASCLALMKDANGPHKDHFYAVARGAVDRLRPVIGSALPALAARLLNRSKGPR